MISSKEFRERTRIGGVEMFGFDWTGDGKENLIDDLITLDILGLLDDENESDEEDEEDE